LGSERKRRGSGRTRKPREASWRLCRVPEKAEALDPKDLSLGELSKKSGVSKCYLSHRFVRLVGCSFSIYKARKRIEKAKRLLTTTDKSVGEISDELGCCRVDHFCKNFKAATGYTTTRFRNYFAKHKRFPPDKGWLQGKKMGIKST